MLEVANVLVSWQIIQMYKQNINVTYEAVSIDAQSKNHVEKFQFDKTRVFESL